MASNGFAAGSVYLWEANMDVALGAIMPAEPFVNHTTAEGLMHAIDLPTAASTEVHNSPNTHVWYNNTQIGLELVFDLLATYDLSTLHFWNYYGETYDVDQIVLKFFDASNAQIGSDVIINPALGNTLGGGTIDAQDIPLTVNGVRYINAVLSGSNGQVDFNNIGFTAVPEPASMALLGMAGVTLVVRRKR